jgi:uncharacterized protein YecE (DUF72 family)
MPGSVHIGTSGWHYKHWKGPFYPEKLPASKMLAFYAERFDTVELNNTFYRLPPENGVDNWRDSAPDGFLFAAKGSRFITHMKKLKDPDTAISRYFERVGRLGRKLGPIVFQTPPWWEINLERLETFLDALPRGPRGTRPKSTESSAVAMQRSASSKLRASIRHSSSRRTSRMSACTVPAARIRAVTPPRP